MRDVGTKITGALLASRDESPAVRRDDKQPPEADVQSTPPTGSPPTGATPDGPPAAPGEVAPGLPPVVPPADAPAVIEPGLPVEGPEAEPPAETPPGTPAAEETSLPTALAPTALAPSALAPSAPAPTELDPLCAAAVDLARSVAVELGGDMVGEPEAVESAGALTVTHHFTTLDPAYVGWRWAVTLTRAEGSEHVTVDEAVLLPGPRALLAPAWVPYEDRVQPGDLGPGDLLPPKPDDPRLVPSYADPDAELADEVSWELGLGRPRVLSLEGRLDAALRWYDGEAGPDTPMAKAAPAPCGECGFLLPLGGSMRQVFGVCANALAPDDGQVVALDHGCGAHSETLAEGSHSTTGGMAVEEAELELVSLGGPPEHSPGTVDDADPAEPLGHS